MADSPPTGSPGEPQHPTIERTPVLPAGSFKEAAVDLRRPFAANAVKWKIQSTSGDRGMIVGYIDARLVIERLNALVPHLWTATYVPVPDMRGWLRCHLTIRGLEGLVPDLTRTDVGTGGDPKAQQSDALKRAAVHFGVGVSLYAIPRVYLSAAGGPGNAPKLKKSSKGKLYLTDECETWLRARYAAWLGSKDNTFGEPIDHGDVEGAAGEVEVETATPAQDAEPEHPQLIDEVAVMFVQRINEAAKKGKMPPAAVKAQLTAALHQPDHSKLEELLERLTAKEDSNG